MKRNDLFLLTFVAVLAIVSFTRGTSVTPEIHEDNGVVTQVQSAAPVSSIEKAMLVSSLNVMESYKPVLPAVSTNGLVEHDIQVAEGLFIEDIPLTYEEQDWLQDACKESDIPYALALGLIERESTFRNILGDDGSSAGYMQVQKKWHWDRMERLGVTDLSDPQGNFRVGCDFLSELYGRYEDWNIALTAYNMGHNPGYISDYAKGVMKNYARWQELLDTYE